MSKLIDYFRRSGNWHFFKEVLRHPSKMGSILPSSPWLAQAMVAALPQHPGDGLIIELGPGTGAITVELQKRFPSQQLLIIERSSQFVRLLKKRFPQLNIIQGDATDLPAFLPKGQHPSAIISSLPLLSLPEPVVQKIHEHVNKILLPDSYYVQYTYHWKNSVNDLLTGFKKIHSRRVWLNIPPARVDTFIRE